MLPVDRRDFFGLEVCGQDDFEHFDVFAVPDLTVANIRRLMDARSGFEPHSALAFVVELDPALEHVDQLKAGLVKVGLARELGAGGGPDDMGIHPPGCRLLDAQTTVLVERPKPSLEAGALGMGHNEALRGHAFAFVDPVESALAVPANYAA